MNKIEKLRNEARRVIASYKAISPKRSAVAAGELNAGCDDFDAIVTRLAAIGYALEDALARA